MAKADYRLCDVCREKAFYDSHLNYEDESSAPDDPPFRVAGAEQFDSPELLGKYGMRLDYCGDWAVLCNECSKTHRTQIVPIDQTPSESEGGHAD